MATAGSLVIPANDLSTIVDWIIGVHVSVRWIIIFYLAMRNDGHVSLYTYMAGVYHSARSEMETSAPTARHE